MADNRFMRISAVIIAALAVVATAWFVLGARQARELTDATAIADANQVSAAQARHAGQLLDAAGTLNPDREVDLVRAALAADRNQTRRAQLIIERATRAEPENLVAWDLLAQISGSSSRLEGEALRHIALLHPPVHGRT